MSIYGDIRVSDCNACFVLRSQSLSMFKAVAAAFEKFELHLTGV